MGVQATEWAIRPTLVGVDLLKVRYEVEEKKVNMRGAERSGRGGEVNIRVTVGSVILSVVWVSWGMACLLWL